MAGRTLCGIALLLASSVATADARISCPQRLGVMGKHGQLQGARLFIGMPEQQREQGPKQRLWQLAALHKQASERGEELVLQCNYKGMKASVSLPVPRSAATCRVDTGAAEGTVAYCQ
jgi:hypothetical protein